jgi:hypothetical protein
VNKKAKISDSEKGESQKLQHDGVITVGWHDKCNVFLSTNSDPRCDEILEKKALKQRGFLSQDQQTTKQV